MLEYKLEGHQSGFVRSVAVSPDGTWAATGSDDKTIRIWDLETGACRTTLQGHTGGVSFVAITPDGKRLLSASADKSLRHWDASSGRELAQLHGHAGKIWSVIALQDNARALSGGADRTLRLWDLASGTCLKTIECGTDDADIVRSVAVHPEGPRALSGHRDGRIRLWDLETSQCLATLHGHAGSVRSIQITPDGRAAASCSEDMTIKIWDLEAGTWIGTLEGHQNRVTSVAISPDGALIASTGFQDDTVRLWDWLGACLQVIEYERGRSPISVAFSPPGLRLVVGIAGPPGRVYVFRLTGARAAQPAEVGERSTLPWTVTPPLLAELKNAVMTMRDNIGLLRYHELGRRLVQAFPDERFGLSAVRAAVTLLANHGLVRFLKFGDLVLLRPDLLNGYAEAILRAARAHKDGRVLEADVYGRGFGFTGVDRLSRPDEELLLRATVQTFFDHALCIAEDTPQGRYLVFPSQIRREKDIPWEPDVCVSSTFGGEWQTVWAALVVRLWYSQKFERMELWRNAAEFHSSQGHLLGLKIDGRQGEGQATISLFFDVTTVEVFKAIIIEYVYRHLARYTRDVKRDRPLIDLIEQQRKSTRVTRQILSMEKKATRELDTQALEQILIGHVMAVCGEADQIFRLVTRFDDGIDGEVEFKDDDGRASGRKIYLQIKSGNFYLRTRWRDGREVFDAKNPRYLDDWISQPVDVYLVIRQTDEWGGEGTICWMNVTQYLKKRKDKTSRKIVFKGRCLDMEAVRTLRYLLFLPGLGH